MSTYNICGSTKNSKALLMSTYNMWLHKKHQGTSNEYLQHVAPQKHQSTSNEYLQHMWLQNKKHLISTQNICSCGEIRNICGHALLSGAMNVKRFTPINFSKINTCPHDKNTLLQTKESFIFFLRNLVYPNYLDALTPFCACLNINFDSLFYTMLVCLKTALPVANSVDPDQMSYSVASDLGLHYLLSFVCMNT